MRNTVPGIISLPHTIRATLDDLNGPEVTFLSLPAPPLVPLCRRRLVPRYQTVYDDSPRLQPIRVVLRTTERARAPSYLVLLPLRHYGRSSSHAHTHVARKLFSKVFLCVSARYTIANNNKNDSFMNHHSYDDCVLRGFIRILSFVRRTFFKTIRVCVYVYVLQMCNKKE